MRRDPLSEMLKVLDLEGDVLRHGQLDALPEIAEDKIRLAAAIQQSNASNQDLEILRAKASANANLLAAAIRGIKAARARLDALSEVRGVLSVYERSGDLKRVPTSRSEIERKA